jgi:hypothetical protein
MLLKGQARQFAGKLRDVSHMLFIDSIDEN